jgi:GT2 family glycosyltransferase
MSQIRKPGEPDVSIVIPAYGKPELTRQCLDSLFTREAGATFEVILVDNASPVELAGALRGLEPRIRLLRNDTNLGFSRACNQGAHEARGRYILLLNNDTEAHPGWLAPLVEVLDREPDVAMVGSQLLYPNGTIQHAGVAFSRFDTYPHGIAAFHVYREDPAHQPWVNRARDFQAVTAACCLVRRSVYQSLGGLDPAFWNGYEDVDLCLRIRKAGYRIRYEPRSVLTHHESMGGRERFVRADQNIRLLNRRWGGQVCRDDNKIYLEDGFLTRWSRDESGDKHDVLEVGLTSIVVIARPGSPGPERCLESVAAHTPLPHEVKLVCDDREWAHIQSRLPAGAAPPERVAFDGGYARSVNRGLRRARGPRIVLLDGGARVGPGWLEALLAASAEHATHEFAAPMLPGYPGPQSPPESFLRLLPEERFETAARIVPGWYEELTRVGGECVLIRAEAVERLGELDEGLPEAVVMEDYCLRAAEAGFRMVLAGDAYVHAPAAFGEAGPAGDEAFARKWGVTRDEFFRLGHRPLRRIPTEPEHGDPGVRELLAEAERAAEAGEPARALRALQEAEALTPELSEAHYVRGLLRSGRGDLAGALAEFEEACRIAPRSARNLSRLGETQLGLGRFQQALGAYGELLKLTPQDSEVLTRMGDCLAALARRDMAAQCYRLAHALAPARSREEISLRMRRLEAASLAGAGEVHAR